MNPPSLPPDERILDVLARWEELRQRSQEIPVEMLCRDCPELISGVKRAIEDLLAWQPLLEGTQMDAVGEGGIPNSCPVAEPPTGPFERRAEDTRGLPERLGDYRILREVGRGGMGVVYEAMQESLGRHVALKILPFHRLMDPTHLERFRREARAAAQLHHTNIVPVFGVGEAEGIHYYAMQFIHGQGLDAVLEEVRRLRLRKNRAEHDGKQPPRDLSVSIAQGLLTGHFQAGPACTGPASEAPEVVGFPPSLPGAANACRAAGAGREPEPATSHGHSELASQTEAQYCRSVAQVGVQVAEALAYAHRQRILHRDIKPSNLLLDTQGTVWITDFGLAKAEGSEELTSPGDIVGTVRFMAPERFQGQADRRSDLYSLGITFYEMLTLRPAFADSDRARLVERVTHEEPARPRKLDPHIPPDLDTIVRKAIAKDPSDRYDRAEELVEDLRRFLNGRPILARPVGQVERLIRWCRRNPGLAGALGAAALFLLLGTFVSSLLAVRALGQAKLADEAAGIAAENERLVREAKRESDHRNYASEMKLASLDAKRARWASSSSEWTLFGNGSARTSPKVPVVRTCAALNGTISSASPSSNCGRSEGTRT
jgi:serine/threonine protein kinase